MDFIRAQRITMPMIPLQKFANGTVLITRGNTDLDYEAGKVMLESNPKHVILARTESRKE